MHLARVLGNVVAAAKVEALKGLKVMIVQPLGLDGRPAGNPYLAVDFAQAGPGDVVLAAKDGGAARLLAGDPAAPLDAAIIAVVEGGVFGEGGQGP